MNTYTVGQQVENAHFGHGIIKSIEGPYLVIGFNESGTKRVMASFFAEGTYVAPVALPEEIEEIRVKTIVTASDIWHNQGIWSYEFTNAMAAIAANSTGIAADISAKFKKSHKISIAQAEVLARVAALNNITL